MKLHFICTVLYMVTLMSPTFSQESAATNGKFTTVNGAKIYYEEYGQGEPLFLLHGFLGTASVWKPFITEYAKKYRVIVWDMRGHGCSNNPDTSIVFLHATAAKDMLALMDKLQVNKVKGIGHSSGGMTLLYAASMAPDRFEAIVPVAAQLYYSVAVREWTEKNAKPETTLTEWGVGKTHGKEKGMFLARQFYYSHKSYGDPALTPDQLVKIKARTLIIHGDNDFVPVSQAWEMFQSIPNARLWVSPNTEHAPQFGEENTPDFIKKTMAFLGGDWDKK